MFGKSKEHLKIVSVWLPNDSFYFQMIFAASGHLIDKFTSILPWYSYKKNRILCFLWALGKGERSLCLTWKTSKGLYICIVEGSMSAYLYTVFCMCQPLRCPAGGDERTKYLSAALYVAILPVQQDSRLHLLLYTAPRLLTIIIYAGQLLFQRRIHYSRRIKTE